MGGAVGLGTLMHIVWTNTQRQGRHKRLAKQKWEVMSHIWISSGKGQGIPTEAWQPTVPLRHMSGLKYTIHCGQHGRLIFPPAEGLLLLSVRSNGCFCPSWNGPNGLEGDFDMVRCPCMFLPWVGTCPQAVCKAVMVPHFHWMWCLGYHATDSIIIFQQTSKHCSLSREVMGFEQTFLLLPIFFPPDQVTICGWEGSNCVSRR